MTMTSTQARTLRPFDQVVADDNAPHGYAGREGVVKEVHQGEAYWAATIIWSDDFSESVHGAHGPTMPHLHRTRITETV